MALTFNGSSSKLVGSNLVTGYPVSMFAWVKHNSLTTSQMVMGCGDNGGPSCLAMQAAGTVAGDPMRAFTRDAAATSQTAASSESMATGVWKPCLVVFRSANSRSVYFGDGAMVTNNTSNTADFAAFDRTVIGCYPLSDTLFANMDIAHAAIWSYSLEDDDWTNLKYGVTPSSVQPQALLDYWSLDTQAATQTGSKGTVLTATDTSQAGSAPTMDQAIPATLPLRDGGGWCWFSAPGAVAYNGKAYVGWIAPNGNVGITKFDPATQHRDYYTLAAAFEADDHDNPTIWFRPDGRIVVFYSKHADTTGIRYRVSTNAEDITAWGTEQVIAPPVAGNWLSYNNPRYLSGNSTLYQHFRALKSGSERPHYVVSSTDNGATWGTPVETFKQAGQRPYVKSISTGTDTIHWFMTQGNPGEGGLVTNVYHCISKLVGGALRYYKSDGTTELTLPISINADLDKVYDSAANGGVSGWQWDCKLDSNGYPRILFERSVSSTDGRCCIVKWTGSAWATFVQVTPMGARISTDASSEYTAGMCFSASDVNTVYVGVESSGYSNIQEWHSTDDGATWSKTRDVTNTTTVGFKNARPIVPLNADSGVALLWWGGTYNSYTDFSTDVFFEAGDPTLTAAAGSFTLTGVAAGLRAGRRLTAAAGSFSLTGNSAALALARAMPAATGSFALTGQAAGLLAARKLTASSGTLTLTGNAATLTYDTGNAVNASWVGAAAYTPPASSAVNASWAAGATYTMTAATGSFTVTGASAALRAARRLAAAAGAFSLSGQAASLKAGRSLAAGQGDFALAGGTALFVVSRKLTAAAGSFALTGSAATLTYSGEGLPDYTLSAGAGTFTLTGGAVGFLRALRLAAETGTYALAGRSAALSAGRVLPAAAATFTLIGQYAGLRAARILAAGAGTHTFTGNAADLVYTPLNGPTYTLGAATGSFALTGTATGVVAARRLTASGGSFALTGTSAGVVPQRRIAADTGTYALSGSGATLRASRRLTAGAASFTLTAQSAALRFQYRLQAGTGVFAFDGQAAAIAASRHLSASFGSFVLTGRAATLSYSNDLILAYRLRNESVVVRVEPPTHFVRHDPARAVVRVETPSYFTRK